jgi:hypothetical protein
MSLYEAVTAGILGTAASKRLLAQTISEKTVSAGNNGCVVVD